MAAMIPFAFFNIVNLFLTSLCKPSIRFHIGNGMVFLGLVVTIILVKLQLAARTFFAITLTVVVMLNTGCAILQGSVLGILSYLPPHHVGGYLEGQALAGILASVSNLVVIAAASDMSSSASAYFAIAIAFIAMATSLFLLLPKNPHYSYYLHKPCKLLLIDFASHTMEFHIVLFITAEQNVEPLNSSQEPDDIPEVVIHKPRASFKETLWAIFSSLREPGLMGFVAFFSLYLTLSLFPSLFLTIQLTDDAPWRVKYYKPIFLFLLFNICDYISRKIAVLTKWPRQNQRLLLLVYSLLRLLLVLAVMFCNQANKKYFPVLFHSDVFIPVFIVLLGFTNGHLLTLAFMYAPSYASPGNEEKVSVAMGLYVAFGLGLGVATSFPLSLLL
ncbi:hypothetical protein Ciccas_004866 [Cichlidogyrus casuarinus]|uniref:Equilibrative nucleoside transporter 1 n=1 Tax=Cichlidogyrus casuarinus TaxID=1844966 RepID=A0ABD2QAC2_9PLAT